MIVDSIGVDISKDNLDCHRLSDRAFEQFPNTKSGFQKLLRWIGPDLPARVVYEPTGPYHGAFEAALADHLPLVKVNPKHARRFAESKRQLAKADRTDARVLAQMGAAHALKPDAPVAKDRPVLRELQAARDARIKGKVPLRDQLDRKQKRLTQKLTRRRMRQVVNDIAELDHVFRAQLETCPTRKRALCLVQSIKGIRAVAATTILMVLLGTFRAGTPCWSMTARDQKPSQKGRRVARRGRTDHKAVRPLARPALHSRQGGRKQLRDTLYLPAIVPTQYNPRLKAKYERMKAAGKPSKVAITTIMRKRLILANTLVKKDRERVEISA